MGKHLFICTGEVSGDLQGSYLIQALLKKDPNLTITAVGGQRMAAAGATLIRDTTRISSIGLVEAVPFILPTLWTTWQIRRFLQQTKPDLAILIDYIGVNSYVCELLGKAGIPVVYYIAPQEWVWSHTPQLSYRLTENTRLILSIFPEEARYYESKGGNVRWVGHPFLDVLPPTPDRAAARIQLGIRPEEQAVMLFPASRSQEIRYVAPVIFAAAQVLAQQVPGVRFWVSLSSERFRAPLLRLAARLGLKVTVIEGSPQTALMAADVVLSKSGTVNLEAALLGIPQVVIYRIHPLTYWIGKHILKITIPFMCPANLVQMRAIVPEFLQEAAQPEVIAATAKELLINPQRRQQMKDDYQAMRLALGSPGVLDRAATAITEVLDEH